MTCSKSLMIEGWIRLVEQERGAIVDSSNADHQPSCARD